MIAALLLALALQSDPAIDKVERIVGDVNRPLRWTPLRVRISSAAGFAGDLVARSGFGFTTAREVNLKPGGSEVVILPAIDPIEIAAGKTLFRIPRTFLRPDLVVLVDASLPYAGDLASTEKILYQKVPADDLLQTLPRGLLEAADLVLVRNPLGTGVVAPTLEEAQSAVARSTARPPSLEVMDRNLWTQAPPEAWVPTKKEWALYFSGLYAFAAFLALAVIAKRYPRFGLSAVAAVALAGIAGFALFPRSQLWAVSQAVEIVPPSGDARDVRLWFVQSAVESTVGSIQFPRLVKPIFPTMAGTEDPFVLRVGDKGSAVEGLKLLPGRSACFGGEEPRPAPARASDPLPQPLFQAVVARAGHSRYLGDLAAGTLPPAEAGQGLLAGGTPFDAWKRFAEPDALFGVAGRESRAAADLKASDPVLVDEHERPPCWILRHK